MCGRSAGQSDSCASREPPLQDWPASEEPRGTPCGPPSSRACTPHLNPVRFAGVRVPKVDERRVAPPRPTPPEPASSPASWTTRGKDHPTGRLSGPCPGKVWHRIQERGPSAEKTSVRECESRRSIPFQGQQERHRLACSKDATSVLDACHIVKLAGEAPGEGRCRIQQDTTGQRGRTGDPLDHIRLLPHASHTQAHPASTRTTPRSIHGR